MTTEEKNALNRLYHTLHSMPAELLEKLGIKLVAEQAAPGQPKLEQWKPEQGQGYYILDEEGDIVRHFNSTGYNTKGLNFWNCFKELHEAEQEALRTRARRKLEWLAGELNSKRKPYPITRFALSFDGGITVQQHNPLYLTTVYFYAIGDAEYALSQMTVEELEALR